jgi:hypothetical protein
LAAYAKGLCPLGLTGLAALGFIFKLFVAEKELFARREYEICPAINALQNLVLEFHGDRAPFSFEISPLGSTNGGTQLPYPSAK